MILMQGSIHTYIFFLYVYTCVILPAPLRGRYGTPDVGHFAFWMSYCTMMSRVCLLSPSSDPMQKFASHRQGYCRILFMQIKENCAIVCSQLTGVINTALILCQPIPPPAVNTSLFHTAVPKLIVIFFALSCGRRGTLF